MNTETKDEIFAAVQHLASLDADRASQQNGCGFSKSDVHVGHLAASLPRSEWTDELFAEVAGVLVKYCNTQLTAFDTEAIKGAGHQAGGGRAAIRRKYSEIQSAKLLAEQEARWAASRLLDVEGNFYRLSWAYNDCKFQEIKAFVKATSNRRWDPDNCCWWVSTQNRDARDRLAELAELFDFTVSPAAKERLDFRNHSQVMVYGMNCRVKPAFPLFPHQLAAIKYLRGNRCALLTDEMGLGKTISALMSLPALSAALVVCPAALKGNWEREAKTWRPDLKPVVLSGRGSFRYPDPGEIVITNFELLPKPKTQPAPMRRINAIVDEAHYLKKARTVRSKSWRALRNLILHGQWSGTCWLMTGTPLVTKPMDLWGVLESAGLAKEAYGSFDRFVDCWGGYRGRFGLEWNPRRINAERAQSDLAKISLGRKRVDVLPDLPAKRWADLVVKVPKGVGELDRDALEELRQCGSDVDAIRKNNALVGQLASARKALATHKANAAKGYVQEVLEGGGGPVVVFSAHRDAAQKIAMQPGWECITGGTSAAERTRIVEAFQAGELEGVAGTIGAMGTGLTLTRSHRMIFIDLDWSPANNAQAEDRINRIGQENACEYIRLVADCEVDRIIHAAITRKDQMIQHVDEARKA